MTKARSTSRKLWIRASGSRHTTPFCSRKRRQRVRAIRRLPMVRIDKKYIFAGPRGKMSLLDLFEGRRQLILYHFMFAPPVSGWPDAGCVGCSTVTDQFGYLAHFQARDTSFCLVSRAPLTNIERYRK